MTNSKPLFWISILLSLLVSGAVYGIYFDQLSETSMMQIAYVSVFLFVFGVAGLIAKNRKLMKALISGVVAAALLMIFYLTIFPSL